MVALSKLRQSIKCRGCRNRFSGIPGELLCPACCGAKRAGRIASARTEREWASCEDRPTEEEIRAGCLAVQATWSEEDRRKRQGKAAYRIKVVTDWLGEGQA